MWPSENTIKKILSGITGLEFDTTGCLKLNEKIALTLDRTLLASAIHSLNAAFDQEEKLTLACQLRDYIGSCHYQDLVKSEKLSLWKNFTRLFLGLKWILKIAPLLTFVIPLFMLWPIPASIILISPIILAPPFLWLKQRLNYRLAKIEHIQHMYKLKALIDAMNQSEQSINPLVITVEKKLFAENEPGKILDVITALKAEEAAKATEKIDAAKANDLAEKLALICGNKNLSYFRQHIGSNYPQKKSLNDALQIVYYRLNGDLDSTLGSLSPSEKGLLIMKLTEEIDKCTPGFHNRVNTIVESFHQPQNFSELLYLVRKHLVEKTAISLTNEVHATNRVTVVAHENSLGIKPNLSSDAFYGKLKDNVISIALQSEFQNSYTLLNLPSLLVDTLRGILIEIGYSGAKEKSESYTVGCTDSEVEKLTTLIKRYLPSSDFQTTDWPNFFIIDDESYLILDINWKFIKQCFFDQLLQDKYFAIASFDDFSKNLLPLLSYKSSQRCNYLMELAHYWPESLKLLFYYLQNHPGEVTEEIKKQLIPLFFAKNKMGQNAVQLAAQYHPDSLIVLLDFIDINIDKFDLDFTDLMRAEKYHPGSLKIILDFTEKHLTPADQQTIQAFFLQKNDIGWDIFINTAQNQPKTALSILNYIIKHQEIFKPSTSEGKPLFEQNLVKIQQGLAILIATEKPDIEHINTLLTFISLYPKLLTSTPKKLAPFIFNSLAIIHDKKIIDAVFDSYAPLLLNYFSIDYFTLHNKNLSYVMEKLLCAYSTELITRKNHQITYTTQFFKQYVGYSTDEKWQALHALMAVMENSPPCEKAEKLKTLKSKNPALNNGRLSQLFKACCNNEVITQPLQIKFQH